MNLISRKQFWMRESVLRDQVELKMNGIDVDGVPVRELEFSNAYDSFKFKNVKSLDAKTETVGLSISCYVSYRELKIGES